MHNRKLQNKILNREALLEMVRIWKQSGDRIVFTNGCFDILHRGHIDYLTKAADLGDRLIVGVNTDNSVRRLNKGDSRPIQDEISRAMILASLECTDAVILFDEETPLELITAILPGILVKGADYSKKEVVGHEVVEGNGGRVELIPVVEGYSTSAIEAKIKAQ